MPDDTRALREEERAALDRLHPDVFTRSRREIAEAAFIAGLRYRDGAEPSEAEVEAAAWEQHQCDGHGFHPDDPHYCWDEHRDAYLKDARKVLEAARKASP